MNPFNLKNAKGFKSLILFSGSRLCINPICCGLESYLIVRGEDLCLVLKCAVKVDHWPRSHLLVTIQEVNVMWGRIYMDQEGIKPYNGTLGSESMASVRKEFDPSL